LPPYQSSHWRHDLACRGCSGRRATRIDETRSARDIAGSAEGGFDDETGEGAAKAYYLDPLRGETPFNPEYQRWFGDDRRSPRYFEPRSSWLVFWP
jgi:hypothetical protein